jgi:hypothetical protein
LSLWKSHHSLTLEWKLDWAFEFASSTSIRMTKALSFWNKLFELLVAIIDQLSTRTITYTTCCKMLSDKAAFIFLQKGKLKQTFKRHQKGHKSRGGAMEGKLFDESSPPPPPGWVKALLKNTQPFSTQEMLNLDSNTLI